MMKNFLKVKFTKNFFAALLQTSAKKIHYGFLVYDEGERNSYYPALLIDDVKSYVFNIENDMLVRTNDNIRFEKAHIIKKRNKVVFKNANAEVSVKLTSFYRHYMVRCVNTLLLD